MRNALVITAMGLFFGLVLYVASLSVAARMGINTDWYCAHLATRDDTFCVVRALGKRK